MKTNIVKEYIIQIIFCSFLMGCGVNRYPQEFESSDIKNFWTAYDEIIKTRDTIEQKKLLNDLYLNKATIGLEDIITVRNYTEDEFLTSIVSYPEFWESIKENTLNTRNYQKEISKDIQKLKNAYPELKPSKIYFTIGAFRTNGTINEDRILIGSELALADEETKTSELPEWRQEFYTIYEPLKNLSLLCTHEYIHTQQNELVTNLLSMCLYEGIAEFISCKVTGKSSNSPAIEFGKNNEKKVVDKFVEDLYLMSYNYNWLWGENRNELQIRDLGYYIGYEIAERYYKKSSDKPVAIKELIELDYDNETEVERIVDSSGLLPNSISNLYDDYENKRPTVIEILEFDNGDKKVDPNVNKITIIFSEPLNGVQNGLDYGPLGPEFYPRVDNSTRKWEAENKAYSFEVNLEPAKKYQMIIGSNFRLSNGIRLKPFILEFGTDK